MATVGIKTLKNRLSEYLRRAQRGERVVVTDRDHPVAMLIAIDETTETQWAWQMVREGKATWSGGKPSGSNNPPRPKGKTLAAKVLEDRR